METRLEVAAFDFDGTLTRRDTLLPFLMRVRGRTAVLRALARWDQSGAPAGSARRDRVKVGVLRTLLAGMPGADLSAHGEAYADLLLPRLRPDTLARLHWHRSMGHRVGLVSASLAVYLRPLGERLRLDGVHAVELEVGEDGALTGELSGNNVRGAEKVRRLEAWLAGEQPHRLWAYGNSSGDAAMLAAADVGVRVGMRRLSPAATSGAS